ncbi:AAA family ATPase [bacterium]|nr:AAA family ATPase [bacterium]
MYLDYWELQIKPFDNTPDPKFFFFGREHEEAFLRLVYTIKENKGAFLLTGEYGCGKTTLIRTLIQECIFSGNFEMAFLGNPVWKDNPNEFLKDILFELEKEVSVTTSRSELLRMIGDALMQNAASGKNTILIIDEAQLIEDDKIFEYIRLLLNYQLDDRNLLTIILVGQPDLREKVMNFPQLDQRVGIKYHLHTLDREETEQYILHRLKVAGTEKIIFEQDAIDEIYKSSFGTPRRINNICDLALFTGSQKGLKEINSKIINAVI